MRLRLRLGWSPYHRMVHPFICQRLWDVPKKSETSFRLPAIGLFRRAIGMQLVGADRLKHSLFLEVSGSKIGESLSDDLEMISIGCLALRISGGFETCLKRRAPLGIFSSMILAGKIEFRLNELEMTVWGKRCGLFQRALLKDSGQIPLGD